jgi:triacylglycerol lipase
MRTNGIKIAGNYGKRINSSNAAEISSETENKKGRGYMRKWKWKPLLLCVILVTWLPAAASAYSAVTLEQGYYYIQARVDGKYADVQNISTSDGADIRQYDYRDQRNQKWLFVPVGDGYYKIEAKHSGKVMDVKGSSTSNGANIQQYAWHGGNNQRWRVEDLGNGYVRIVAKHSGKVMHAKPSTWYSGAEMYQQSWDGGSNQQFKVSWFEAGGVLTSGQWSATGTLRFTGDNHMWQITVPSGNKTFGVWLYQMTPKPTDFDLYIKRGLPPDTGSYDHRRYTDGRHIEKGGERWVYYNLSAGTWFLCPWSYSGAGDYKLIVTQFDSNGGVDNEVPVIQSGELVGGYLGGDSYFDIWRINVPSNTAIMRTVVDLGNNSSCDFDVYGRYKLHPSTSEYAFRGYTAGGEDVSYSNPSAGWWYIYVNRYTSSDKGDYTLKVTLTPSASLTTLTHGQTFSGSLNQGQTQTFRIVAGSDLSSLRSVLTCGSNNFDLYARREALPTTSAYDWRSIASGGEDYTFVDPLAGNWYIMVRATSGSGSYSLTNYLNQFSGNCGTQYPVILAHGMGATDQMFGWMDYWWGIKPALEAKGAQVYVTQVNAMDSTSSKAEQFKTQVNNILAASGKTKANVIGHSHGTIYTRYAISNLGIGSKVVSHTSIGGVHKGSAVADVVVGVLPDSGAWLLGKVIDYVYAFFVGDTNPNSLQNAHDLTRSHMQNTFNPNTPNVSGVYYQSWSTRIKTVTSNLVLEPTFLLLNFYEGYNDGLTSVESQKWGTHRGTKTGAWWCGGVDHLKQVGHLFGFTPGFSAPNFYVEIVSDLRAKGH